MNYHLPFMKFSVFVVVLILVLVFPIYGWISDANRCHHYQERHHIDMTKVALVLTNLLMSSMDEQTLSTDQSNMIQVIHQPDTSFLTSKGVMDWPTWGCPISKFPWSYSDTEICYLIRGKVIITPVIQSNHNNDGSSGISTPPKPVTIVAGDYVTLPAGLSCTWDVIEAVEKHYMFN